MKFYKALGELLESKRKEGSSEYSIVNENWIGLKNNKKMYVQIRDKQEDATYNMMPFLEMVIITDSMFVETEFTRAFITTYKHERHGYSISIESELLDDPYIFVNKVPKCKTEYSAYASAEWFLEQQSKPEAKDYICCKVARMYTIDKKSTTKIANELGYNNRQPIIRLIKRHIRHTFKALTDEDIIEIAKERNLTLVEEKPTE